MSLSEDLKNFPHPEILKKIVSDLEEIDKLPSFHIYDERTRVLVVFFHSFDLILTLKRIILCSSDKIHLEVSFEEIEKGLEKFLDSFSKSKIEKEFKEKTF